MGIVELGYAIAGVIVIATTLYQTYRAGEKSYNGKLGESIQSKKEYLERCYSSQAKKK